jgi:hypothetical protein
MVDCNVSHSDSNSPNSESLSVFAKSVFCSTLKDGAHVTIEMAVKENNSKFTWSRPRGVAGCTGARTYVKQSGQAGPADP